MRKIFLIVLTAVCALNAVRVRIPSTSGVNPAFLKNIPRRGPSTPYISGDTFRWIADWKIDEFQAAFDTEDMVPGDIIFINSDFLPYFFQQVYDHIRVPFILLTHNSVVTVPGRYSYALEDEKLIAWFGHNVGMSHAKLHPLPVGFANRYWPHGSVPLLKKMEMKQLDKNCFLYLNITPSTNAAARNPAFNYFSKQPFCTCITNRRAFETYLHEVKRSYFVVSPPGRGIDCHRNYETLLMGSIPVMKSTTIDPVFDGLPVVIVKDWHEVTEEFLLNKLEEFSHMTFNFDKLYGEYWIAQIRAVQAQARTKRVVG